MYYGFNCIYVDGEIALNYMEYLHCPTVDYELCEDFPCEGAEENITCTTANVNLTLDSITIDTAVVSFVPTTYGYIVELIKTSDNTVVDTKTNPTSPITYTGLLPATNYKVKLTTSCPGGETRSTELPLLTLPTCVVVEDFTGVAEDVNEFP